MEPLNDWRDDTRLTHAGRDPASHGGTVNTPLYRASTFVWPNARTLPDYLQRADDPHLREHIYGRNGNPTTAAFEDAVAALEGGFRSLVMPSGLAAIAGAVLALVKAGDHVLVTDNCYGNARQLFERVLPETGVEVEFFPPLLGSDIAALMRAETRLVYAEAPGSNTFEVQDIPALARVAHAHGALLVMDNTWATPLFFKPFVHGVDVSIQAATKYLVGHSDAMLGVITTSEALYSQVRERVRLLGYIAGSDDAWLGLRGLRTLGVRLRQHQRSALAVARWLTARPEVLKVLHPALPDCPGHALFQRDFLGASGLFGVVLRPVPEAALHAFLDGLQLFAQGASWGGFESLIRIAHGRRRFPGALPDGPLLRLHVGLEAVEDLIADLDRGFARLRT
ncbi:cystathionine beta-lyase [Pseudomonas sp. 148P]|uniref:Cystathionine beta-lyase n=1 Tax=Pseudomonas ulcerans TaxID=3115852 RepID=A0ABU7HYD5_9PSED|nr:MULTISPECIES: cystathionine beta-lyase [unclassified Pseudomonas]MEE1925158.1 cystathionine beta-lyase [Pseudomonas sp. 147P]MEE1936563.1 cystathionine beta-lyase [Pseudomonas sp. 148P]